MKLDDYLCIYNVEEFKKLPVHPIRKLTIQEEINNVGMETPFDEVREILKRIAVIKSEAERDLYIGRLIEKTNISKKALQKEIKALAEAVKEPQTTKHENIILAHPSFEVNQDFVSIGFRETIIVEDESGIPKPVEQNIYIISTPEEIILHERDQFVKQKDKDILFDLRGRTLLTAKAKWNKKKILDFIEDPKPSTNVYQEIKRLLKQHIDLSREVVYGMLAAWIIATYFFMFFSAFPFIFIFGRKGSGKSRLLDILEWLTFNAVKTKGVTLAALTDTVDGIRGVFLIDQAESLNNPCNEEIVGILADSYRRYGGRRRVVELRVTGRRILEFETYAPKVFASYKDIHFDLKDRCIEIVMTKTEVDFPDTAVHYSMWSDIRDTLYRLLLTRWKDVMQIYPNTGKDMRNRTKELWRPIETVLILEKVPEDEVREIKTFFLESMHETQNELTENELGLFGVLRDILKERGKAILTATDIAKKLKPEYTTMNDKEKKSLQSWIGKTLKLFKLWDREAGRIDTKRAYEFSIDRVEEILKKYASENNSSGIVVESRKNQGISGDNSQKNIVVDSGNGQESTTQLPLNHHIPLDKNEVVSHKQLSASTIATIPLENPENKEGELSSLEVIEI